MAHMRLSGLIEFYYSKLTDKVKTYSHKYVNTKRLCRILITKQFCRNC